MAAKSKSWKPRSRKPDSPSDIEKRIRQRAYELYDQRGRVNGFALDDWLRAEAPFAERRGRTPRRNRVGDENLDVDRGVLWAT
jgi:DUF2934 family protein